MSQAADKTFRDIFLAIIDWFKYLKSKWRVYFICGIIAVSIGLAYALYSKITYTARLTFVMEDDKGGGGMGGAMGLASSLGFDLGSSAGDAFSGSNLLELMKSRRIIQTTLLQPVTVNGKTSSLFDYYIETAGVRKAWAGDPRLANMHFLPEAANPDSFSLVQDSVMGAFYQHFVTNVINVFQKDKKVSIFTIETTSGDEYFAKIFTEQLAKVVSEYYVEIKSHKSQMNVAILQRQADSVRRELTSSLGGVASANDNTFNLNPGLAIKRVPSMQRQVDVQVNTALLAQIVANLEVAKVSLRKETPLIQVIDKPIMPLSKQRMSRSITMLKAGIISIFFVTIFLVIRRLVRKILAA